MSSRKLDINAMRARYGDKAERTITRWTEVGILPQPIYINNRRYWDEEEVEAAERNNMTRKPRKPGTFPHKPAEETVTT